MFSQCTAGISALEIKSSRRASGHISVWQLWQQELLILVFGFGAADILELSIYY